MTQENKDRLLSLLQQYQELGIAEQIDFDKSITDSLIANSIALVDSDYGTVIDDSEEKWSIKPSLAEKLVDILQFVADKEEIRTENIVAHFGLPRPLRSAIYVSSRNSVIRKPMEATRTRLTAKLYIEDRLSDKSRKTDNHS